MDAMPIALNAIGQITLPIANADRSEAFYGTALGLRKLYRFGTLVFFNCAGVRLLLDQQADPAKVVSGAVLYFRCADIMLTAQALKSRGIAFVEEPHRVTPMEDHDLWMAFFRDPDGHLLALMQEAPKGWQPAEA
jgi:methylmalonyl-CoA/ethylmalonyl-CoA epimerase